MKNRPLIVAVVAGVLALSPTVAFADDFPPDHSDFDQAGNPEIDCATGTWTVTTVHWSWWDNPDETGGRWYTNGESIAPAPEGAGGGVPAECPWWQLGDDGVWFDARTVAGSTPDTDEQDAWLDSGWTGNHAVDEADPEPLDPEKVGVAAVWKLGING